MIGRRLNLRIEARSESDEPLVQELLRLRAERDRRYRRWESGERISQRGGTDDLLEERRQVEQEVLDAHVPEGSTHHDFVVSSPRAEGVEVLDRDVVLTEVRAGRLRLRNRTGG